tara:strand:- start:1323 stop:1970 length:648 start_codon:yes stop_codon:yes gene_type:complete
MVRTKDLKAPMNNRFDVLKEPEKTRSSEFTKRPRGGISSGMRRRSKRAESAAASSKPNEFRMQHSAFPELGKSQSAASQENATNMNFAEATKPEEFAGNIVDEVDPGWVKLTRNDNKTKYQYNKQTTPPRDDGGPTEDELSKKGLDAAQEASLYKLTERWQNYRDVQNNLYPNNSLYMNEKSLLEPLSDDCYETESDYSESDESDEDPDEYNDDF